MTLNSFRLARLGRSADAWRPGELLREVVGGPCGGRAFGDVIRRPPASSPLVEGDRQPYARPAGHPSADSTVEISVAPRFNTYTRPRPN